MIDNTTKLTDFAITKLNAAFDAASRAVPVAAKYVLVATSWDCFGQILTGFVLLAILSIYGLCYYKFVLGTWRRWADISVEPSQYRADSHRENRMTGWAFGIIGLALPMVLMFAFVLGYLLNYWAWVGIWHPDLYLTHQAIKSVLG